MDIRELSPDDESRIYQIKGATWIGYDRAVTIRNQMDALLKHPRMHRMPNLAILGESNNGKTMLMSNFCKRHNPPEDPDAEKTILPAVMIQTPPAPDEGRLYNAILEHLSAPGSSREPEDSKLRRIKLILMHLETKILLLDDFFNIGAGTKNQRAKFLNALRNLSIELQMPIIISGTPQTLNILSSDPSLSNRFKPHFLPRWKETQLQDFARFVLSIEKTLQLKKPCNLMTERSLVSLLAFGEGLLGEVVDILRLLAESAIRSGIETIDESVITKSNLQRLGWVSPSDRAKHREPIT